VEVMESNQTKSNQIMGNISEDWGLSGMVGIDDCWMIDG